jgi:hypothetical protein
MTNSGYWVERKSARGHVFRVWRRYEVMPPIPQLLLDCSIYLYESRASAEGGENFGGSGCLVSVETPPIYDPKSYKYPPGRLTEISVYFPPHIYAVTNKHVALRGFPVVRLNTLDGTTDVLELDKHDWIPHPDGDDLVVAPVDLPQHKFNYFPIGSGLFVDQRAVTSQRIGAGDDTFMVGRFVNHAGQQRNTPSLRFGSIAMLPFEKIKLGKEANNHMQEAFLVETRSMSGFSGSPVFVYRPSEIEATIPPGEDSFETRHRYITTITELVGHVNFLGIDCGHVQKYEKVVNGALIPHPQWKVAGNTGMAIVIPAWRLLELLNTPELIMQRKNKDKKYQEEREAEESAALDLERPEPLTKEGYEQILKRASRKISESQSKDSDSTE